MKREEEKIINTEFCVIGGGLAGVCAAISAARRGVKVVLIQDRPVLGGNASGEIRMWIRGASVSFPEYREGGILEELAMDNIFYNPRMNYSEWDGVVYNKVIAEKNITLLLNTSCVGVVEKKGKIESVTAWQLTTYTNYSIHAQYYADCSGDSIVAEFTDAKFRKGREGKKEYGESYAPEQADSCTMGNSCLIQARETDHFVKFKSPPFAHKFSDNEFQNRFDINNRTNFKNENFWWIEIGGDGDVVKNAEEYNRELIARAFGVWDYIKNSGRFDADNWELDWVGFLAGKRESRRYVGDYVLNQNDIERAQTFPDEVVYGGWSMDDHNPLGIHTQDLPNIHYPVTAPYPIPYRCLYSANISNLFFAGRNVSVTHMALSSTRVMATCAMMGQAVGTACSLAVRYGISPRGVGEHMEELQQSLRDDDCFLLHTPRKISEAVRSASPNIGKDRLVGFWEGNERTLGGKDGTIVLQKGEPLEFVFSRPVQCGGIRLVFDNDISGKRYPDSQSFLKMFPNRCSYPLNGAAATMANELTKEFRVYILTEGQWKLLREIADNHQRLVKIPVDRGIEGIRFVGDETYGHDEIRLYSFDIYEQTKKEEG